MFVPGEVKAAVDPHLREAAKAIARARALLDHGEGHRPEALEDALNLAQDETYQARRAFNVEAVR